MALSTLEDLLGITHPEPPTSGEVPVPPASFLPVYFHILERYQHPPPSVTTIDQHIAFVASPLTVFHALEVMIGASLIPNGVLQDLRPRIWKCMSQQIHYIAELDAEGLDICTIHLSIIRQLGPNRHPKNPRHIISSTPGIRAHLTRLWAYFLHHEDMWSTSSSAAADISRILPIFFEDCIYSEIVEGAGGNFLDVASLVTAHTNMITSTISASRTFLHAGLVQSYEMITALDSLEFVTPLEKLATVLWSTESPRLASQIIERCLPLIESHLAIYPGAREAIDTQLIVLVARCAIAAVGNNENAVQNILRGVLSGTLTFYPVLGRVEKALLQVDSLNLTSGLRRSTLWNDWAAFCQLAEERLLSSRDLVRSAHLSSTVTISSAFKFLLVPISDGARAAAACPTALLFVRRRTGPLENIPACVNERNRKNAPSCDTWSIKTTSDARTLSSNAPLSSSWSLARGIPATRSSATPTVFST
ncbi:hypothetical protein DFH09DRAFT_1167579 [Mycena vulgaris]|nr:hypothetical protein DFH09DRAFT_1167579 [Mycena vulgaris]